jgi:hypothetical protein
MSKHLVICYSFTHRDINHQLASRVLEWKMCENVMKFFCRCHFNELNSLMTWKIFFLWWKLKICKLQINCAEKICLFHFLATHTFMSWEMFLLLKEKIFIFNPIFISSHCHRVRFHFIKRHGWKMLKNVRDFECTIIFKSFLRGWGLSNLTVSSWGNLFNIWHVRRKTFSIAKSYNCCCRYHWFYFPSCSLARRLIRLPREHKHHNI